MAHETRGRSGTQTGWARHGVSATQILRAFVAKIGGGRRAPRLTRSWGRSMRENPNASDPTLTETLLRYLQSRARGAGGTLTG